MFHIKISHYFLICLLSVVTVPEFVGARTIFIKSQIAQPATQADITSDAALHTFDEEVTFYKQGTVESLKQAIVKWQEALELWWSMRDKKPLSIEMGDKSGEAIILNNIGSIYHLSEDKQQALKMCNQAGQTHLKLSWLRRSRTRGVR